MALGLTVLAMDVRTLAPSVLWSDEGEFQFQIAVLGVPHQTGYPLYVLLGKVWTWLAPVGDVAYRVNLLSAVFGALTVVLVYFTIKRLSGARLAALAGAAALAVSPAFWQQSSIAGVRTFHTAFVALITLLAVGALQGWASVGTLALAVGLSLAHHRMTLLLLPGLAWIAAQVVDWKDWRKVGRLALLILAPQLFYVYLLVRQEWGSAAGFLHYVLATQEVPIVLGKSHAEIVGQFANQVFPALWRALTPPGLLVALIGLAALLAGNDQNRRVWRAAGVYLAVNIPINIVFAGIHFTEDPTKYLTHGLTLMAAAFGVGLAWLPARLARERKLRLALAALGLAVPLASGVFSFSFADQSRVDWIGAFTLDRMTGIESGSVIVADWSFGWPMRYHQGVEGHRRDLTVLIRSQSTEAQAEAALLAGQPVYIVKPGLIRQWKGVYPMIEAPNGLVRVLPGPPEFGPPQSVREPFGDAALALTGLATWPARLTPNQMAVARLYWQSVRPPENALSLTPVQSRGLSVRLVSAAGDVWAQHDMSFDNSELVEGYVDVAFLLDPALPIGDYHWQVVVDDPEKQQTLGLADLPPFSIERPASPASPESVVVTRQPDPPLQFGGWALLGANPPAEVRPGEPLLAPLFWHRVNAELVQADPLLQVVDRSGEVIAEAKMRLPVDAQPGDLVGVHAGIKLPRGVADGDYGLRVVFLEAHAELGKLRARGRPHVYRLPGAVQARAVQLGERIELAAYTLAPPGVLPGETTRLTLYWRALDSGKESLKVFVHVVGGQEQLLTQQDGLPVHWTAPTDTWVKGEIIADEYSLAIPPGAAAGAYTIYVGMYDPASGQRLPAIEQGQRLANDRIELARVIVLHK